MVVGADGLVASVEAAHATSARARLAQIGDARWARSRWWDLGVARIRHGADTALQDGASLGAKLAGWARQRPSGALLEPPDLGEFAVQPTTLRKGHRRDGKHGPTLTLLCAALAVGIAVHIAAAILSRATYYYG